MTPLKILLNLIHKLTLFINGFGQPKVKQSIVEHETITAIKVKEKQPEVKHNTSWVTQEPPKNQHIVTGYTTVANGYTGSIGYSGTKGDLGTASGYRNNNIKLGGKYFDPNTYQEILPEDLKDLFNGGDNIVPTEMWQMNMNKKSTPQMRSVLNKSNKK